MNLSDFDYELPKELIAQKPLELRDHSKLMCLDRSTQSIEHHQFFELPELMDANSVLVFNESKVIPARIKFALGNGKGEILLIKQVSDEDEIWECMVKPGAKLTEGAELKIDPQLSFKIEGVLDNGLRRIRFHTDHFAQWLVENGHTPTPPYVKEELEDSNKYQTVYAKTEGSVAAPTAGFHFTDKVFEDLKAKGIQTEFVTLHVGLGTFQPVKTERINQHQMHSEWFELDPETAQRLNEAKYAGKKIVAVGTTSVRVLESAASKEGYLEPQSGETDIFIYPGYKWKIVDQLITNFHVPKSTLLMLVSSFANRDFILEAYETAKQEQYRFFSFGDSMWIR